MSLNDITNNVVESTNNLSKTPTNFEKTQGLKGTPYAVLDQINAPMDYLFEGMQNLFGNKTPKDELKANSTSLLTLGGLFGLASKLPYGNIFANYLWAPGALRELFNNPYVAYELGTHGMNDKGLSNMYIDGGSNLTRIEGLGRTFVAPNTSASYIADEAAKFTNPLLFFGTPMASDVVRFTGKELNIPALEHIADSLDKVGKFSPTKGIRDLYNEIYDPDSAYSQKARSRRDNNYKAYEKDLSHLLFKEPWTEWWKAIPYAADYLYTDLFTEENYKNKE